MARPWSAVPLRAYTRRGLRPSIHVLIADRLPAKTLYWAVVRAAQVTDPTASPSELTAADLLDRTWADAHGPEEKGRPEGRPS